MILNFCCEICLKFQIFYLKVKIEIGNGSNSSIASFIPILETTTLETSSFDLKHGFNNSNSSQIEKFKKKLKIKDKLKNQVKLKGKFFKIIPLQYDVEFEPIILNAEIKQSKSEIPTLEASPNTGLDMKLYLNVKLYCNYSTNKIRMISREFINIDLKSVLFYRKYLNN